MSDRTDGSGAAYKGSQLQTQLYVNARTEQLDAAIRGEFPDLAGAAIEWRSPLADDAYREYQDAAFLRRVGLDQHEQDLAEFWPRGGPVWDALAVVDVGARPGVILAEGKSYPDELFGSGCQASPASRNQIEAALAKTQAWVGVAEDPASWCGRLYQTANRLAHLYFFRELCGVRAWLVHLLFVDDPHGPTSADQWGQDIRAADAELGLTGPVPAAGHVLLPAAGREELTGGPTAA